MARYRAAMRLPFEPPVEPMLAKASDTLPEGDGWLYEPKWDGFRALVFRDGDEISPRAGTSSRSTATSRSSRRRSWPSSRSAACWTARW